MSQIAQAPVLNMPEPLQIIFLYLTAGATALLLIYCVIISFRKKTIEPVLLLLSGFCAIPLEPLCTYLGHSVHPVGGNIMLFHAVDRYIPWHVALGYTVGFGLFNLFIWHKVVGGTITHASVWKACIITVICYQLGEIVGVSGKLWVYYDPQPVWLLHFTAPLPWSFLNTAAMVMVMALVMFLRSQLTGLKVLLIPVLGPVGALMGHFGAGWPMYNIENSNASPFVMQLSGVAAIVLSVLVWWIASLMIMTQATPGKRTPCDQSVHAAGRLAS